MQIVDKKPQPKNYLKGSQEGLKRLEKEIKEFKAQNLEMKFSLDQIKFFLKIDDDPFHYHMTVPGPEGSVYIGKKFKLPWRTRLHVRRLASVQAAKYQVANQNLAPEHLPDERGSLCRFINQSSRVDFLENHWSPALTLSKVLLSL